jgi:excisionase family DNA binding protein
MANDKTIYMTPEEVAEHLQISTRQVYRLLKSGKLVAVRFGPKTVRFLRSFIESLATPAAQSAPEITA